MLATGAFVGTIDTETKTGGGLSLGSDSPVAVNATVTGCWFEANTAISAGGMNSGQGGGRRSYVQISNATFFNNSVRPDWACVGCKSTAPGVPHSVHSMHIC